MDLDAYQQAALRTHHGHDRTNELFHLVLGLVGESGEIAEKFKKWVRDTGSDPAALDRDDIAKELGDVSATWPSATWPNWPRDRPAACSAAPATNANPANSGVFFPTGGKKTPKLAG